LHIPEPVISEILHSVNIVDFIAQYVQLKKSGNRFMGLCPFHSEKTPSFSVSPDKNLFYCFGCGTGGNIFTFLMEYENISFPESVIGIARHYGIAINEYDLEKAGKEALEREDILKINTMAADFYRKNLFDSNLGNQGMSYLLNRGLPHNVIEEFFLGFALPDWENLISFLRKRGVPMQLAEKSGLIIKSEKKQGYYDRFRERVIFPIFDTRADIIGFGGRTLGDGKPKYLNSPETAVYHKSRSFYGLSQARASCRELNKVYIVEGYMDLISLVASGIKNVVATLGTALSYDHIRILKGFADKMILVYDGDTAGINAAMRSVNIFLNEEVESFVFLLPDNMDPDDYIKKYGPERFIESADLAEQSIDFLIGSLIRKFGDSVSGKVRIIGEIEPVLKNIKDSFSKSLYVDRVASLLGVKSQAVHDRLNHGAGKLERFEKRAVRTVTKLSGKELSLLSVLLELVEIRSLFRDKKLIELVEDESLKECIKKILETPDESMDAVLTFYPDIQSQLAKMGMQQGGWTPQRALKLINEFEIRSKARMMKLGLSEV